MSFALPKRVALAIAPSLRWSCSRKKRRAHRILTRVGFTLVELLVVITIIGVLIGLLLPAVQSAREAGRRTTCKNNLHQLALGGHQHMEKLLRFPAGGWYSSYAGNPIYGTGKRQHGGWIYNVLPYMEQENLWSLGLDTTAGTPAALMAKRIMTASPFLNCPSRRPNRIYPVDPLHKFMLSPGVFFVDAGPTPQASRSDYAANSGTGLCRGNAPPQTSPTHSQTIAWADGAAPNLDGVIFQRSMIRPAHVLRGMSYCYLAGEKYLSALHYTDGKDDSDEECAYTGGTSDNNRTAFGPPLQDQLVETASSPTDQRKDCAFGSNHPYGFNMAFCDGSVRVLKYSISPDVHKRLANRKNEEIIDDSTF